MAANKINGRIVYEGVAKGKALVSKKKLSFYGSIDFKTGKIQEKESDIYGKSIKGTILVFPGGKGSTVGSIALYRLHKSGLGPKAIINIETEPIIATGAILSEIPLIDKLEKDPTKVIKNGDTVLVDCDKGFISIEK
ncbi:aconitase X swivel domain-containing protein [Candidatus Undinarchaeota archaeon]